MNKGRYDWRKFKKEMQGQEAFIGIITLLERHGKTVRKVVDKKSKASLVLLGGER